MYHDDYKTVFSICFNFTFSYEESKNVLFLNTSEGLFRLQDVKINLIFNSTIV